MDDYYDQNQTSGTASISSIDEKSTYCKETNDKCVWDELLAEREEDYRELNEYLRIRDTELEIPPHPELQFLEDNVFPVLLPILEKTLRKAKVMESLKGQRNLFNGVDYIAERLWNTNEKHPERVEKPLNIFLVPWVQQFLIENPRKIFPLSWILTKQQAAIMIQSFLRGYFVRKREDVQEMRQFWKTLRREKYYVHARRTVEDI